MKLFVATHNKHKIREISQILPDFEIVPDDPEGVVEDADAFDGNALIKVRAIAKRHAGEWCMADDSGLEVRALGGAPGVFSARYAGEPTDSAANNALLLKNLSGAADRSANFTCAVALVSPDGEESVVTGKCFGRIADAPSGDEGFGYDPLFIPDGYDKSFASLPPETKNSISHRSRALAKVRELLSRDSNATAFSASDTRHATCDETEPADATIPQSRNPIIPQSHNSATAQSRNSRFLSWMRFFRVVNLPTVPGDILVGAAAAAAAGLSVAMRPLAGACAASVLLYMYGLADNDIVGAKSDGPERPIPAGEISLVAAHVAKGLCLAAALALGVAFSLPTAWWIVTISLTASACLYNRTKLPALMGLCRALDVTAGAAAFAGAGAARGDWRLFAFVGIPSFFALAYIWYVTRLSDGEEQDSAKRSFVGSLIGATVYLQLTTLMAFALLFPYTVAMRRLLVAGAMMLVLFRVMKTVFPKVSAS